MKQTQFRFPRLRARSKRRETTTRTVPPRKSVPHSTRPEIQGVIHVVLRIARGLPDLRTPRALRRLERSFRAGKERDGFGLVHYSIQRDHLHLVVDARNRRRLARGMQALAIRVAKGLNAHWNRRKGQVFAERYFAVALKTWQHMIRAVRYVLSNGRKHGVWRVKDEPDPYSSGPWFPFWGSKIRRPTRSPPVVAANRIIHYHSIDVNEVPGPRWHEAPHVSELNA